MQAKEVVIPVQDAEKNHCRWKEKRYADDDEFMKQEYDNLRVFKLT